MNPSQFYGKKTVVQHVRSVPQDSDDSELSDSEDEGAVQEERQVSETVSVHSAAQSESESIQADSRPTNSRKQAKTRPIIWKTVAARADTAKRTPDWNGQLPDSDAVKSPIEYFRYFYPETLLDHIVE